jgi:hypothetical protein
MVLLDNTHNGHANAHNGCRVIGVYCPDRRLQKNCWLSATGHTTLAPDRQRLNRIGLVLGMVGVVVIFIWGPPQPNLDTHGYLRLEQEDKGAIAERDHYKLNSAIGLGLIGLGFAAQLVATWR